VSLAQHLLAYAWMFKRDVERLTDAQKRIRVSPLGAAALAGTTYPLDPAAVARDLGLSGVFANSMDAVSDRDFVIEALSCGSLIMLHLSRLCEEIILWANPAFGFVRLPDAYSTGSAIMPQKKNPDVCELMRGKTGRVYGALTALLTMMKGLPLAYNRDMQEDKEPFLDADRTVSESLALMAGLLRGIGFAPEAMRRALSRGFLNATELADYLAAKGLPFREAHHAAGAAVALAEQKGCGLEDLSLAELKSFSPLVEADVFEALRYETAVARRNAPGGTGPVSVARQMEELASRLAVAEEAAGAEGREVKSGHEGEGEEEEDYADGAEFSGHADEEAGEGVAGHASGSDHLAIIGDSSRSQVEEAGEGKEQGAGADRAENEAGPAGARGRAPAALEITGGEVCQGRGNDPDGESEPGKGPSGQSGPHWSHPVGALSG
jgi:hypothetical protein